MDTSMTGAPIARVPEAPGSALGNAHYDTVTKKQPGTRMGARPRVFFERYDLG